VASWWEEGQEEGAVGCFGKKMLAAGKQLRDGSASLKYGRRRRPGHRHRSGEKREMECECEREERPVVGESRCRKGGLYWATMPRCP
jgi:hypothetical protein